MWTEYRVWEASGFKGVTTDLYSYLKWLDAQGREVVSIETRSVSEWTTRDLDSVAPRSQRGDQ